MAKKWAILYHTKDGSYMQPVYNGESFLVEYKQGQLYGECSLEQLAPQEDLDKRGLAYKVIEGCRVDSKIHEWDSKTCTLIDKVTKEEIK